MSRSFILTLWKSQDSRKFGDSRSRGPEDDRHQRGVKMMLRGAVDLIEAQYAKQRQSDQQSAGRE